MTIFLGIERQRGGRRVARCVLDVHVVFGTAWPFRGTSSQAVGLVFPTVVRSCGQGSIVPREFGFFQAELFPAHPSVDVPSDFSCLRIKFVTAQSNQRAWLTYVLVGKVV